MRPQVINLDPESSMPAINCNKLKARNEGKHYPLISADYWEGKFLQSHCNHLQSVQAANSSNTDIRGQCVKPCVAFHCTPKVMQNPIHHHTIQQRDRDRDR